MEIFIKIQGNCIGGDYENIISHEIAGEVPTEQELAEIQDIAKTDVIDSLSFEWSYDIITTEEAEAGKEN